MLKPTDVFTPAPTAVVEEAGEMAFLNNTATGNFFALGAVGLFIWRLLDGRRELGTVASFLVSTFDVEPREAHRDTFRYVRQLHEANLVLEVNGRKYR